MTGNLNFATARLAACTRDWKLPEALSRNASDERPLPSLEGPLPNCEVAATGPHKFQPFHPFNISGEERRTTWSAVASVADVLAIFNSTALLRSAKARLEAATLVLITERLFEAGPIFRHTFVWAVSNATQNRKGTWRSTAETVQSRAALAGRFRRLSANDEGLYSHATSLFGAQLGRARQVLGGAPTSGLPAAWYTRRF